jgi:hypothetical protein
MGDSRHHHYVAPPSPANAVITLSFTGQFDQCGCAADCGCVPNAPRIAPQYFVPPEAAAFVSVAELNEISTELSSILANNHIPPMPLMFTHFCIPFSPVCVLSLYASRTDQKLNEFIESINRKTYVPRNCHW